MWMAAVVLGVLPFFTIMTIDQRIRTHALADDATQFLIAIGLTTLGVTAFLPMNRESTGHIEKYFRIGLAIQSFTEIIDINYSGNSVIYQIFAAYVVSVYKLNPLDLQSKYSLGVNNRSPL